MPIDPVGFSPVPITGTELRQSGDESRPWPWKPLHSWGIGCLVLAGCTAFLFPVAATAGTATMRDRVATTGALVVVGVMFLLRGRTLRQALAVFGTAVAFVALMTAIGTLHAPWLAGLFVVIALHVAVAKPVSAAWRRVFPRDPDREEEAGADVLESIATAFILALVVREFAFEAFKIPTGSMETTIHGDSGLRPSVPLFDDLVRAIQFKEPQPGRRGDRLLAAKMPLVFGDPQRWSIMVFKYPLFRPTNYIKRLVGLPGEHVENRNGDIYVNGKIVAKPEEVQETLWSPLIPNEEGGWPTTFRDAFLADDGGKWVYEDDAATGTAAAGRTGWIIHNETQSPDMRATFDVDAGKLGDGAVLVRLEAQKRRVELEARRDAMWLTAPGMEKTKLDVPGLGTGATHLSFAVADRVVRVAIGGRLKARIETADAPNVDAPLERASIGVTGGTARIAKIRLEHDLQYTRGYGPADAWDIPAGCFLMLGDHTAQSKDSRAWTGRVFRLRDGSEIVADRESVRLDDNGSSVPTVHDLGDHYVILDSYGVERHVAKSDVESDRTEPRPFVRREDLVGRAFLMFFPFPPFGEWRPRVLP